MSLAFRHVFIFEDWTKRTFLGPRKRWTVDCLLNFNPKAADAGNDDVVFSNISELERHTAGLKTRMNSKKAAAISKTAFEEPEGKTQEFMATSQKMLDVHDRLGIRMAGLSLN